MFIFKTANQMKKIITFILLLSGMASYAQVKPKQITPGSNGQAIMVRNGQTVWDDIDWADIANKPTIPQGTVTSVTGTAPISVATGTTTPVISITKADGSTDGYLSSGDWTTFNNKASLSDISASAPLNWNSTTGNMTITRGNLVAGSNVTLSGTIANRLVGSGNVTINADVSPSDIYGTEDTLTHIVVSGDIASGVVSITLNHAVKTGRIPLVWINGVKARWGAISTTGTTLKITNANLPYNVTAGDEIDIKYVY